MSKHTPGPWIWDGNVCNYDANKEAPWLVDCTGSCPPILGGSIRCKSEADARLIAAAPDLLEALIGLLSDIEEYQSINLLGVSSNHWQVVARAAIAKATGETK